MPRSSADTLCDPERVLRTHVCMRELTLLGKQPLGALACWREVEPYLETPLLATGTACIVVIMNTKGARSSRACEELLKVSSHLTPMTPTLTGLESSSCRRPAPGARLWLPGPRPSFPGAERCSSICVSLSPSHQHLSSPTAWKPQPPHMAGTRLRAEFSQHPAPSPFSL